MKSTFYIAYLVYIAYFAKLYVPLNATVYINTKIQLLTHLYISMQNAPVYQCKIKILGKVEGPGGLHAKYNRRIQRFIFFLNFIIFFIFELLLISVLLYLFLYFLNNIFELNFIFFNNYFDVNPKSVSRSSFFLCLEYQTNNRSLK